MKLEKVRIFYEFLDEEIEVLKDINLELDLDKFYFVSGEEKSGKTTFLRFLTLLKIGDGEYKINNVVVKDLNDKEKCRCRYKMFGIIFDNLGFDLNLNVYENILLGLFDKIYIADIDKLLEYFKLSDAKYKKIYELSYFDKVKVALIRALVKRPKVLVIDDIFKNLNNDEITYIMKFLKKINTGIIVASVYPLIGEYADVTLYINKGVINDALA